ncbi:mannonate dehydratase [Albibacterium sp.]|uniref:mannonate dehydratase n=1 Tax=Albibacterium sp. TaxID=2952885 RepID=UPI002C127074|nr:mannonate dehydratase [Albibacterium sp.]HUH18441.1 mannonate dehydratase [Albibacterium sp.]
MALLQSWRWYGPDDPVSLQDIKQAGAEGIVSALHQVAHGEIWPIEEILERKKIIEEAGLKWVVVESVPVHEEIKTKGSQCELYLSNYRQTLQNLAACGLQVVCYNFMPVLDWTRTKLDYVLPNGSKALYFDWVDLSIFDLFILKRENAEKDYSEKVLLQVEKRFNQMTEAEVQLLKENILMGVPTEGGVTLEQLTESIEIYKKIGFDGLRENLAYFLQSIMDTCQQLNIKMTIHPDDPPYSILGLPRIASSKEDLLHIIESVDHPSNGICLCTGSLGANPDNDAVEILKAVGHRVYFAHLRNVQKDENGNFYESDHLTGDVDMAGVMKELVAINKQRANSIPFRPDHGHQMLDDLNKVTNPGYSAIGRLKGLAELRGLEMGIESMTN